MPSLRHSSAMLSSPRRPSNTIRILSSAEKCRRVARRMSLITCSAGFLAVVDLRVIFVPHLCDEAKTLLKSQPQIWAIGADGEHRILEHNRNKLQGGSSAQPHCE